MFCGLVVSSGFVALNACARSAVCSVFQPCETQERYDVHTPPAIAIELHNAKRFQQRFQLQKGFVFGVCPPIRQYHPSYDQLPTPTSVVDVWIARNSTSCLFRLPPRHCLPGRVELLFGSVPALLTRFHSPPSGDSFSYNNTSETLHSLAECVLKQAAALMNIGDQFRQ